MECSTKSDKVHAELPTMATYITHLAVSVDENDEKSLQSQDFKKIKANLKEGTGAHPIHLWYKKQANSKPISRLQLTFNAAMHGGLINAGYAKIGKNLNAGTRGNEIYLWYFKGETEYDTPIVDISVTTHANDEAGKLKFNYERLVCDVNRNAGGNWIHIWLKREKQTYICDITATDNYGSDKNYFDAGYIRVDEDTNRGAGGADVFIWYRQTTDPKRALTDVQISTNDDDYQSFQQQQYTLEDADLNQGSSDNAVYLWTKKIEGNNPIKSINLLLNQAAWQVYEKAGARVIEKNLNTGNCGSVEYLSVHD